MPPSPRLSRQETTQDPNEQTFEVLEPLESEAEAEDEAEVEDEAEAEDEAAEVDADPLGTPPVVVAETSGGDEVSNGGFSGRGGVSNGSDA